MNFERDRRRVERVICLALIGVCLIWGGPLEANSERHKEAPLEPTRCEDELSGLWRAHHHFNGNWYRLTMEVERSHDRADALKGRILSRFWPGRVEDGPTPRDCNGFQDVEVQMPSTGRFHGDSFVFLGDEDWSIEQVMCGGYHGGYIPDGFFGTLAEDGERLEVNWLGIRRPESVRYESDWRGDVDNYLVGEGVIFTRLRCTEKTALPTPALPAPKSDTAELAPPSYSSGCLGLF